MNARRWLLCFSVPVLAALALTSTPVSAAADPAVIQEKLQEAVARLNLSPAQQAQLKPVFQARTEKLKAIRDKHAGDTSRRARRAMLKDAKPVQKEYEAGVEAVLDDTQKAEWKKMRGEAREQLKTALQNRTN